MYVIAQMYTFCLFNFQLSAVDDVVDPPHSGECFE